MPEGSAVRHRELDVIVVWRLDRWGRPLPNLVVTLRDLTDLGVGFVSLTEALDLTTPTGRAMAGMLAVFAEFEREILRERVRAGIAQARKEGHLRGPPVPEEPALHAGRGAGRSGKKPICGDTLLRFRFLLPGPTPVPRRPPAAHPRAACST